jgi:hypothetical protein
MGEGQEETSIVTSSGNYVIAWDFQAIKKSKYDKYDIRRCFIPLLLLTIFNDASQDIKMWLYKTSSNTETKMIS